MTTKIDISIDKANESLKPVLNYLRELINKIHPKIEENIKWNYPSFEINKKNIITLMIFKNHINFTFHNGIAINDNHNVLVKFGEKSKIKGFKQLKKITDLPEEKILTAYILEAIENEKSKK